MGNVIDELLRWPFNAGETCGIALFVLGLVCLHVFVEPDRSHWGD